jgi:error-prone DNA polymerase
MSEAEHVVHDYAALLLSLKTHPGSFVREKLDQLHVLSTAALTTTYNSDALKAPGLVSVRQRSGTAKGVCFMTIEDETGYAILFIFQNLFDECCKPTYNRD